jgi:single-strand DNA-binding protein
MYETNVTVVGNLATAVDRQRLADGRTVANFRVASTERRYDRAGGGWVDGESLFIDVRCWRTLADNADASLVKGDRVVVTGRLFTRSYEHEGQRRSAMTLDAQTVAPDLSRCTAVLTRTRKQDGTVPAEHEAHGDQTGQGAGSPAPTGAPAGDRAVDDASRLVGAAPGGES